MKEWFGLADLIEDTRHLTMKLRKSLTAEDLRQLAVTPRVLVNASNRAAEQERSAIDAADRAELDLSNYLIGQYEEALTYLGSVTNV